VRRAGRTWLWSRGEELVTDRFPEIEAAAAAVPEGTVLDGEMLVWHAGREQPEPFTALQRRIGRKAVTRRTLAEAPVRFIAYDLLERDGMDLRGQPQEARRAALEAVLQGTGCGLSPLVPAADWTAYAALRDTARERGVDGFMLKHRQARYGVGRRKAAEAHIESPTATHTDAQTEAGNPASAASWWKWKVDPLRVDAVLIYAQAGHGRRAGVYTDYTFAVWNRAPEGPDEAQAVVEAIARREPPDPEGLQLVSFAKAYSGLTDAEFARVDRVIRATTLEKFGSVRSVRPTLVFELGFEGLNASARHRSGIAVRFPRMLRIRDDKPLHEADTLDTLRALMQAGPLAGPSKAPVEGP